MRTGQTVTKYFYTEIEGKTTSSESLPVVSILRGNIITTIVTTVSLMTVGNYSVSFDIPSDWKHGETVGAIITVQLQGALKTISANFGEVEQLLRSCEYIPPIL